MPFAPTGNRTQKSGLCTSPGQQNRADPVSGSTGEEVLGHEGRKADPPHLSWGSKGKANMLSPLVTCGRAGLRSMKTEELALRASIQRVSLALLVLVV